MFGLTTSLLSFPAGTKTYLRKEMAEIAAERSRPVEIFNLQTGDFGVALPAAKETKAEGSVAFPVLPEGDL